MMKLNPNDIAWNFIKRRLSLVIYGTCYLFVHYKDWLVIRKGENMKILHLLLCRQLSFSNTVIVYQRVPPSWFLKFLWENTPVNFVNNIYTKIYHIEKFHTTRMDRPSSLPNGGKTVANTVIKMVTAKLSS